jgi:hypothetical protein
MSAHVTQWRQPCYYYYIIHKMYTMTYHRINVCDTCGPTGDHISV